MFLSLFQLILLLAVVGCSRVCARLLVAKPNPMTSQFLSTLSYKYQVLGSTFYALIFWCLFPIKIDLASSKSKKFEEQTSNPLPPLNRKTQTKVCFQNKKSKVVSFIPKSIFQSIFSSKHPSAFPSDYDKTYNGHSRSMPIATY